MIPPAQPRQTSVQVARIDKGRKWYDRWRWDVVSFRLDEGNHSGVFDHWVHLDRMAGYAATKWGALLAASRHVDVEALPYSKRKDRVVVDHSRTPSRPRSIDEGYRILAEQQNSPEEQALAQARRARRDRRRQP